MPAFKYTFRNLSIWSFIIILICGGCKQSNSSDPYPYTPNDFDEPLRDLLKKIEQHNIVYLVNSGCRGSGEIYDASQIYIWELKSLASHKNLFKASKCKNPVIRAYAIQLLLETTIDPVPLVKEHLFDTAFVFDDSNQKWTIISLLFHSTFHWNSTADRKAIEKELLKKQPFEKAAYILMLEDRYIDTFPGFYEIVRSMARNLGFNDYNRTVNWEVGQGVLSKLASYRYQQDIPLLDSLFKISLYSPNGRFIPARAIQIFPAPEFDKYFLDTTRHWKSQFRFLRIDNFNYDYDKGLYNFIDLVINHKSKKSAILLEKILEHSPLDFYGNGGLINLENDKKILNKYIAQEIRKTNFSGYAKIIKLSEKHFESNLDYSKGLYGKNNFDIINVTPTKQPDVKPFRAYWWQ